MCLCVSYVTAVLFTHLCLYRTQYKSGRKYLLFGSVRMAVKAGDGSEREIGNELKVPRWFPWRLGFLFFRIVFCFSELQINFVGSG